MTQSSDEARIAAILAEVYEGSGDGRRAFEAAIERHPDLAEELRSHAAVLDLVGEAFEDEASVRRGMPEAIGGYRILEVIGRGGMATVYRAIQEEPIRREVAVKVMQRRVHGVQAAARFDVERESLARMEHPHIARVLDAGFTEREVPYVVMELVVGEPITDFCERRALGLDVRLGLFTDVCEAIQHAHQKGVIHRDIKPSNVLVTDVHEEPHVKVIDFGLAKPLDDAFAPDATITQAGQILGTPAYMSPEQAMGGDVDATTDVYSLGMLLYELLVGEVAWDRDSLASENFAQFIQRLAKEEPPRPSARLSTLSGDPATTSPTWERRLRGELDWITMKALAKERKRRYASPQALADDLARFLGNEPVNAGPPSTSYRFRKFLQRHTASVVAAAVVVLALVAGFAISVIAQRRTEAAREEAEARREAADHVIDYMIGDLKESLEPIGRLKLLGDVAERIRAYYEETAQFEGSPASRRRRAEALRSLAMVLQKEHRMAESAAVFDEEIRLRRRIVAETDATDPQDQRALLKARLEQTSVHFQFLGTDQRTAALTAIDDIVERTAAEAAASDDRAWAELLVSAWIQQAWYRRDLALHKRAVERVRALMEADPDDVDLQRLLAHGLGTWGDSAWHRDVSFGYETVQREVVSLRRSLLADSPLDFQRGRDAADAERGLAWTLASKGRHDEALPYFASCDQRCRELSMRVPESMDVVSCQGWNAIQLARAFHLRGLHEEALRALERAEQLWRPHGLDPARLAIERIRMLTDAGQPKEALATEPTLRALLEEKGAGLPADALVCLAGAHAAAGNEAEALRLYRAAREAADELEAWLHARALEGMARVHDGAGRRAAAIDGLDEVLPIRAKLSRSDRPILLRAQAKTLEALGRHLATEPDTHERAKSLLRQALDILRRFESERRFTWEVSDRIRAIERVLEGL